jgi:hypothetical protein
MGMSLRMKRRPCLPAGLSGAPDNHMRLERLMYSTDCRVCACDRVSVRPSGPC